MIENIDITLLEPHPDNPRKDVGDVSELAEIIKESGVLQNLTVVPHEGKYRVIIGHRRLAADCDTRGYFKANYGNTPPEFQKNEALDMIYEFLGELGYRMSTEEEKLKNGTHELFGGENK